ncbi:hypothetical protein LP419_28860 [Massilia sp. H-1]|nr:hypothetical protein LP419_28860 [Massilia sp. H-1]
MAAAAPYLDGADEGAATTRTQASAAALGQLLSAPIRPRPCRARRP